MTSHQSNLARCKSERVCCLGVAGRDVGDTGRRVRGLRTSDSKTRPRSLWDVLADLCGSNMLALVDLTSPSSKLKEITDTAQPAMLPTDNSDNTIRLYDHQGIAPRRGKRRLSSEARRQIADQRRAGVFVKQLATDYDLSRQTIMEILRAEGIPARKATLGPEHRDEIARLYATGLSIAQVAIRFGVSDDVMYLTFKRLAIPTRPRRGMG